MNYLYDHTPLDLLREDWLANLNRIYKMYVDKCCDLLCECITLKDLEPEIQVMLEEWYNVFKYTEYDPDNLES